MRVGSISILRARPEAAGAVGTVYLVSCVSKKRLAPSRAMWRNRRSGAGAAGRTSNEHQ